MTITDLEQLVDALYKLPKLPASITVSLELAVKLKQQYQELSGSSSLKLCGIPIIESKNYRPEWWSEDFQDGSIVLHTSQFEVIRLSSSVSMRGIFAEKEK